MAKRAIIFGASGLVGSHLLKLLRQSEAFDEVFNFVRKRQFDDEPGYREIVVDFERLASYSYLIKGDSLFCCLGTTIAKAGSKERFAQVDLELPVHLSRIAERNKIHRFIVISSLNAHADSSNFYLRTKGEMERLVMASEIPVKRIIRPSLILGNRNEVRVAEQLAAFFMRALSWAFIGRFRKYKAIKATDIAQAMLNLSCFHYGLEVVESDQLSDIASGRLLPLP
ncbi:MAG: NAD(P)H-binding protein [Bacteroidetes bacterium]|nr:NAD(P)H-binding protein [Bacteroidota bacterium]